MMVGNATKTKQWFEGPECLRQPQNRWPQVEIMADDPNDPEIKRSANANTEKELHEHLFDKLMKRYSKLSNLRRTIGWILFFISCLRTKRQTRKITRQSKSRQTKNLVLPLDLLKKADDLLIRHVQSQSYAAEIISLNLDMKKGTGHGIRKTSSLFRLDPFLDNGIIRVGGRLRSSNLPYEAKHPILIPHDSALAVLILRSIHITIGHQGKNAMFSELRRHYWIPLVGQLIKQMLSKCVLCHKYQAKREEQKMADLPEERAHSGKPPFSNVGMDYFGPFEVKRGRTTLKRYGVIFTCCSSRAIHIEVAHTLTTDSCINAIRRFLARRGNVESIRSDNGTNLVGAERELRESINQWNHAKITKTLQQRNIRWIFNPPSGSHFGGFWERLIRSVRKVMFSVMKEQHVYLNDEGLNTLMCEVEYILNCRPLTPVSSDPNDDNVLTPNHILLMKDGKGLPPGIFDSNDAYVKQRWRQIQFLSNIFWRRWTREYLPLLQTRQKWIRQRRNIQVGDIVLMAENTPRNVWPLGRVMDCVRDKKGLVRVVKIKTGSSTYERPIDKLCVILEADK